MFLRVLLFGSIGVLCAGVAHADEAFEAHLRLVQKEWPNEKISERRKSYIREFQRWPRIPAARFLMLEVLAKDPAGDVLREAVRVLAGYNVDDTVAYMTKTWRKSLKDWEPRGLMLLAFGWNKNKGARQPVLEGLTKEKDSRVVVCAAVAAGRRSHPEFTQPLVALLTHRTRQVRIAAMQSLAKRREEGATYDVFKAFCAALTPRERYEGWQAMKALTREDHGVDPKKWKGWFDEAVGDALPAGSRFPTVKGPPAIPGAFFRIPVYGDKICFVLDTSGDQDNAWAIDVKAERAKAKEDRTPSFFTVKTRWDLTIAHVKNCLNQLPKTAEVGFVLYYNKIRTFPDPPRFMKNSEKNRKKIIEMLKGAKRDGTTAMYEALKLGWGFLKAGNVKVNFAKGADTIVFTTDGRPTAGELKDRADRLADEVWRTCVLRGIRLHAVGYHNHAFELLKNMAKASGGTYVHAQQAGDTAEPQDLDFWPKKKAAFEASRKKPRR